MGSRELVVLARFFSPLTSTSHSPLPSLYYSMNNTAIQLRQAFLDALKKSDPARKVASKIKVQSSFLELEKYGIRHEDYDKIYVFGAGKAAKRVATGLNNVLGDRIHSGCVISGVEKSETIGNISILPGDHPAPGLQSIESSNDLINQLRKVASKDLVFFITTGGASSMFCVPEDGLDRQELRNRTEELLRSGNDIHEMNRIRAQWDKVKGGKTLSYAKPKAWINLLISDVPGDDASVIGSGPAIATPATPASWLPETYHNIFLDTPYRFALSLGSSINAVSPETELTIAEKSYSRDVDSVAEMILNDVVTAHNNMIKGQNHVFVYHGESTVKVSGNGAGGRNHHLGLLLLSRLDEFLPKDIDFSILSAGTDGIDGNTGAAGIACDREKFYGLVKTKENPGVYLSEFDSGSFFKDSECVIKTGPTGTNLMDVQVVLVQA